MDPIPWTGDPVDDIETAKRMIARHPNVDLPDLLATAADRAAPHSARIVSIWTLGFVDAAGVSRELLARLADDPTEPPDVRDHAQEAITLLD